MFRALTIAALVVAASAAPVQIYGMEAQQSYGNYGNRIESNERCPEGLARRADGKCVEPIINRSIFLYNAPKPKITYLEPDYIPTPKVYYNYVFLKTANAIFERNPIVVPAAQQKTVVYVLNKQLEKEREVIQLEGKRDEPQVHFVNYKDSGENQELPGGVDLRTALGLTVENGENEGVSTIQGDSEASYSQRLRAYWRHNDEHDDEEEEDDDDESDESSESSSEEDSDEEDSDEEDSDEDEEEDGDDDEEHENESEHESDNEHEEGSEQEGGEEQQVTEEGGEEETVAEVDLRSGDQNETNQGEEAEPTKEEVAKPKKAVSGGFPPAYILN